MCPVTLDRFLPTASCYFNDMQINRWLHSSSRFWEIPFHCNLFRKKNRPKKLPFKVTNKIILLAAQRSVNFFFGPSSLIFLKSCWEEDERKLANKIRFAFQANTKTLEIYFLGIYESEYFIFSQHCTSSWGCPPITFIIFVDVISSSSPMQHLRWSSLWQKC